jgi:hypothetical protein
MKTLEQKIILRSPLHFGRKVPSQALGEMLKTLPNALRYSIRMAFEGRSRAPGKWPGWLASAADVRFVGHSGEDETVLHFEVPPLGEAAAKIYEQGELWANRPDPADSAFDLLADVIAEVGARNEDSQKFDKPLLNQVARFRPLACGTFTEMAVTGQRHTAGNPAVLTPAVIDIARSFSSEIPQPRRVRIAGKLDMLRASTQAFGLIIEGGEEVPGVFVRGDIGELAPLFQKEVLVLGKAVYRPSGRLLRIDAETMTLAAAADHFFSQIPRPRRKKFDLREIVNEQAHKKGIAAILGKWPGDESDEEIEHVLKELS